jgi:PadR family transcriptional regulator, regulatory protein PadR
MSRTKTNTARAAPLTKVSGARAAPLTKEPKPNDNVRPTPREQIILLAIHGRELYGLAIIRAIEDCSNGRERITVGTVYPVLTTLEQKGLVHARWGEECDSTRGGARRRYYKLSEAGNAVVQQILDFQQRLLEWQDPSEA